MGSLLVCHGLATCLLHTCSTLRLWALLGTSEDLVGPSAQREWKSAASLDTQCSKPAWEESLETTEEHALALATIAQSPMDRSAG